MSLADRCQHAFSSKIRSRGDAYFRNGAVRFDLASQVGVRGTVSGSDVEPYDVLVSWAEPEVGVVTSCTCVYYEDGDFCKHVWAAILAADAQGLTAAVASGRGRLQLIHRWDIEDGLVEDDWGVDDDDHGPPLVLQRASPAPSWQTELMKIALHSPPPTPRREALAAASDSRPAEIRYVLDVADSLRAGAVVINLFRRTQKKNGIWGPFKSFKVQRGKLDEFPAEERRLLALLLGAYSGVPWNSTYYASEPLHRQFQQSASQVELTAELRDALLPELCATGSMHWILGREQPPEESRPLAWDDGPPWQFRLLVGEQSSKAKGWRVRGELVRGGSREPLESPVLLLSDGLVVFTDRIAKFEPPADWRWLHLLRAHGELAVPPADRAPLLAELWSSGLAETAELPAQLRMEEEATPPRGVFRIFPAPDAAKFPRYHKQDRLYAEFAFDYAGQRVDPDSAATAIVDAAANRVFRRDEAAEQALIERLVGLRIGPKRRLHYYEAPGNVEFPVKQFSTIVEHLAAADWHVEAEGKAIRRPGEFHAIVSSGVDWFDLEASLNFDGVSASLPQLLDALKRKDRFITLDDGTQGMLPDEWLARYAPLVDLAAVEGDRLRFRPSQALLLDALLAARQDDLCLQVDRQFTRLRDRLRSFEGIKPRTAPPAFRGELRHYQQEGLGWFAFLAEFGLGGCLADDMGLGKTVQVLAWLATRRRGRKRGEPSRPSLVVAPKSVVFNWQNEAERFAPKLKVVNYTGTVRRELDGQLADADLIVTSYGTLRNDIDSLKEINFDYAILDEAQTIKNEQSVSAKACRLLQADHRLALTGTPVENHLGDLWSIFEFLNPGMLGRSSALQSFVRSNGEDADALESLRRGVAPFILRRTKEQVLSELPKKTEQTLQVHLLPADRKRYNELRDHYRASLLKKVASGGMNSARMHVLEALLRLRQAACHPGLIDPKLVEKPSAKIDALLEQVAEVAAEGHKALVFSQFTSLLAIVRPHLAARGLAYEYLDGRTRNRQERIERFQADPECPLFLISLKAGGTGLNLTAADYVFLLDPWWNPAVEAQAIDRAHRIGQHRPVFAYRLVARDTVEEKIIELQKKKRSLADAIITGDKGVLSGLTADDLQALLG